MEFAILGPVEVRVTGESLPLGGRKQRALLAQLLLAPNEAVSRDRLVDGIWGDVPPPSASRTIDSYVSRLRTVLGADRIERRDPGYALRVEPHELDAACFEQLLAGGRERAGAGDLAGAVTRFDEALGLWRGAALADLVFEPFAQAASERLEERRLLCREARFEVLLGLGAGAELVGELETYVAEHPFRERLLGQLMLALYRSGRQSDALAAYRRGRQLLASELGLEPGPELRELERRILEHDPALEAPRRPKRATHGTRNRLLVAAAAALAVAAAGGGVAAMHERSTNALANSTADALDVLDGHAHLVGAPTTLPDAPAAATSGASSLWLAEPDVGKVVRVDEISKQIVQRITVGGSPGAIAFGDGAVWVAGAGGDRVLRIDPATDTVTRTIRLGSARADAIAYGLGALWIADGTDDSLLEVDPRDDSVAHAPPLTVHPTALALGAGGIWIADYDAGTVTELDPRTRQAVATIHVGNGPVQMAVADGYLWVANSLDSTVSKIDPSSDTEVARIPVGSTPDALASSNGTVWVANRFSGTVTPLDALSGAPKRPLAVGGAPTSLAAAGSRIWVGTEPLARPSGGTLVLQHTRVLHIDPALNLDQPPFQSDGFTRDTLVTYDHAGGPDGALLVPDLAVALPQTSPGTTVYRFRLRKGVRYDDGRYVHASDVRRELERLFRLGSEGAVEFANVVGADACNREHCDLSRGVVTDDAERTITFHLVAPDPDFLEKLTIGGLVTPVPPGTPWRDVGYRPIPATGPYEIAHADKHEIVWVRNPYFKELSHAAQPAGNPDRIVMRAGAKAADEVRAIEADRADWTADGVPARLMPEVETRFAAQLHSFPNTGTDFLNLNTHLPPFDDVRVRRALNFAVDRAEVVRLYGGRIAAAPACQLLPPGVPGFRRSCPYTEHPSVSGRWTAPDLARARELVAASHTRGERVVVWGLDDGTGLSLAVPYVVGVLRALGYRATAHLVSAYPEDHSRIQIAATGYVDPTPDGYFDVWALCSSAASHRWACDPAVDRTIRRDAAFEASHPRAAAPLWAALDRELMRRADWVPLVNARTIDFVSRRVGNYEFNPVLGVVADQLSVRAR